MCQPTINLPAIQTFNSRFSLHHRPSNSRGSSLKDGKDMMASRSDYPPNFYAKFYFASQLSQKEIKIITFEQVLRALSQEEWKAITVTFAFPFVKIHRQRYLHFQQHGKE